ncbi:MAG: site-specific integrase [Candidatus Izemoplasmatales bacterium]
MLIEKCFNDYLEFVSIYRKNGTYKYYTKIFKSLLAVLKILEINSFEKIESDFFDKITKCYLEKTNKKNSQINSAISVLITVLNYYKLEYPKRIKLKDDTKSFTALSDTELKKLLDYLDKIDLDYLNNFSCVLAVYLFLDTGVRFSEILQIRTKYVDFENNSIYLEHTKNGYFRYVFFGGLSKNHLIKMISQKKEFVLWNFIHDRPMKRDTLYHFFDRLNKDLKFRFNLHPHRLRKTFATNLLKNGCNLAIISKLLGHRDIKQTMIYLQTDNILLSSEYNKFYPYER